MTYTMEKLNKYLSTAIGAARIAGAEALAQMDCIECHLKDGNEVVTQADPICQDLIMNYIRERYPEHGFIAEEGPDGKLLKIKPTGEDYWWVVDPIDGTNNYCHKVLSFSISVGLIKDGYPILGVICIPPSDTLFTGIVGQGATCDGLKIKCGNEGINQKEALAIDSYWDNGIPDKLMRLIDRSRLRNLGSTAMHLAYVASGGFVGAVVNRNKMWDFVAGAAIIAAAGGKMVSQDGSNMFPLDPANYQSEVFKFIAANPAVCDELVDSLK